MGESVLGGPEEPRKKASAWRRGCAPGRGRQTRWLVLWRLACVRGRRLVNACWPSVIVGDYGDGKDSAMVPLQTPIVLLEQRR